LLKVVLRTLIIKKRRGGRPHGGLRAIEDEVAFLCGASALASHLNLEYAASTRKPFPASASLLMESFSMTDVKQTIWELKLGEKRIHGWTRGTTVTVLEAEFLEFFS